MLYATRSERHDSGADVLRVEYPNGVYNIRVHHRNGVMEFYVDSNRRGARLVCVSYPDGSLQHYKEGSFGGAERLTRCEWPDGTEVTFSGDARRERKTAERHRCGTRQVYEGPRGMERLVRVEFQNGSVQFYEGPAGRERLHRVTWKDGTVQFFEGETDAEREVQTNYPSGIRHFYEGPRGEERIVRTEWAGTTHHYTGERHHERLSYSVRDDGRDSVGLPPGRWCEEEDLYCHEVLDSDDSEDEVARPAKMMRLLCE